MKFIRIVSIVGFIAAFVNCITVSKTESKIVGLASNEPGVQAVEAVTYGDLYDNMKKSMVQEMVSLILIIRSQ